MPDPCQHLESTLIRTDEKGMLRCPHCGPVKFEVVMMNLLMRVQSITSELRDLNELIGRLENDKQA